jgi:hypothetical protein
LLSQVTILDPDAFTAIVEKAKAIAETKKKEKSGAERRFFLLRDFREAM